MKKLIVKDNALIEASYSLGVVEQRILLLAILAIRQKKIPKDKEIKIHAQEYMNAFNVERHASYEALREGAKGLFEAKFRYEKLDDETGEIGEVVSRWLKRVMYIENIATIKIAFNDEVLPLIGELERRFTQYEIEQVAGLQSRYAIRLYEMLMQWRSSGQTPELSLQKIRDRLGLLENEYKRMCDFKSRVIDTAIDQINEHTDIKASYEQHKQGRSITGFTFSFKQKPKPKAKGGEVNRDDKTGDLFSIGGLSDAQLARITRNEQFKKDYGDMVSPNSLANTDAQEWTKEMVKRLKSTPELFTKRDIKEYLS